MPAIFGRGATLVLLMLLPIYLGAVAQAADAKTTPAAEATKAGESAGEAKAAASRKAGAAAPADPMETLREKLAAKLGAARAPGAKGDLVVRISTKAEGEPDSAAEVQASSSQPKAKGASSGAAKAGPGTASKAPTGKALAKPTPAWSYDGEGGPHDWHRLKPEFSNCAGGARQSPIDIRDGIRVDLDPVNFDYRPSTFRVVDNGHTVQVNMAAGNSIEVTGRRYELLQFHFHRPSEERIDGRQFDMVAHLVHRDPDGRLAVVAVLLDRGSAQPVVQAIWNNLPLEKNEEVPARAPIDLNQLLPKDRRYYTYMGSLTTPPCSEGVLWVVLQQPVPISPEQIEIFSRLYPMNARPAQQAGGRVIKQSN